MTKSKQTSTRRRLTRVKNTERRKELKEMRRQMKKISSVYAGNSYWQGLPPVFELFRDGPKPKPRVLPVVMHRYPICFGQVGGYLCRKVIKDDNIALDVLYARVGPVELVDCEHCEQDLEMFGYSPANM